MADHELHVTKELITTYILWTVEISSLCWKIQTLLQMWILQGHLKFTNNINSILQYIAITKFLLIKLSETF